VLFVVMRRAGVRPWLATAAASLFALFGAGGQDIVWAFQIAFTGALLLPLLQMLLADHDGPVDRRDWLGLLLGLLGLMFSGVAVAAIGVVALATLIRRGWRPALLHSAPLYALFAVWYVKYSEQEKVHHSTLPQLARWVRASSAGVFDALGQVPFVGWLIGAMLVVGFVLAWWTGPFASRRRTLAMPTAMVAGAFAFQCINGVNRAALGGTRFATSSRYMHIVAALLIPAIAVAAEAIIRRRREFAPVVLALLVIGIPGNLGDTMKTFPPRRFFTSYEQMIRSLPRMPLADDVPRSVRPELTNARQVTVGWLRDSARSGRIPAPSRTPTTPETLTNTLRLSLQQVKGGVGTDCVRVGAPVQRVLRDRESLVVLGTVKVRLVEPVTGAVSGPVTYGAFFSTGLGPHTLRAVGGDTLTLLFKAAPFAQLCKRQS
jgi:hypothetical protein